MRKPRIIFLDTYYPEAMREIERRPASSYQGILRQLLDLRFGTADFVSGAIARLGWEASDVVANSRALARAFMREKRGESGDPPEDVFALAAVHEADSDVVAVQNVSLLSRNAVRMLSDEGRTIVLFSSYAMVPDAPVDAYDFLFTSFPHYREIYGQKTRVVYLPLAFGREATEGMAEPARDIPVSFVGGLGHPAIWGRGQEAFEVLAQNVPEFSWWGYAGSSLGPGSALKKCWRGPAWGRDMYGIYLRSRIVVNRHGEIARGYANNMRLYEATGSGALLVTESAPNLAELFQPGVEVGVYDGTGPGLVDAVRKYLSDPERLASVAAAGRAATLSRHTFDDRARILDGLLREAALERSRA